MKIQKKSKFSKGKNFNTFNFNIRVKRQHSDYNYDYDGYDDYEEPEQEPLDINELFQMELPEKAKSRIELRLKKHFCKKFASQGSGEPCQFSKGTIHKLRSQDFANF